MGLVTFIYSDAQIEDMAPIIAGLTGMWIMGVFTGMDVEYIRRAHE